MNSLYYLGLDVHKKTISYCLKLVDGSIVAEGTVSTQRKSLEAWLRQLPKPWCGAMEATLFTGWIYDFLLPHAKSLQVAHPAMLKAISASKKKNDKVDARMLADLLRCNLLPVCYMAPPELRELRRLLRYRSLMVRQAVRMKNKTAGLLMEVGAEYNKEKLHQAGYFRDLLETVEEVPDSVKDLLKISRGAAELFDEAQRRLVQGLLRNPLLKQRVERLRSIRGVGEILALTWAVEVGEPSRFPTVGHALSYCGLTSAQISSAGKEQRAPISKQRNKHLQTILIEASKVAPLWNPQLKLVHEREKNRGNPNRATLAVARKLVAYLLAVDRSGQEFQPRAIAEKETGCLEEQVAMPAQ
ncbi:IS110 family RNA-guided transposase [Paludibaculum fermentans]|uniref:IS110 family transposase n=1 Tax=Paludibaculum fermentans TaxID=1473598 RepID=A0A7S7SP26_PALFE|nr:IS110 family transposase [Paludibaculum fermentans]QOY90730.1 IS110 family transposase [Paludibaculum fermentans]